VLVVVLVVGAGVVVVVVLLVVVEVGSPLQHWQPPTSFATHW
jgi:hypothetical protein